MPLLRVPSGPQGRSLSRTHYSVKISLPRIHESLKVSRSLSHTYTLTHSRTHTDQSRTPSLYFTPSLSLSLSLYIYIYIYIYIYLCVSLSSLYLYFSRTLVNPLHAQARGRFIAKPINLSRSPSTYREVRQLIAKSAGLSRSLSTYRENRQLIAKPVNLALRIRQLLRRMGQLPSRCQANWAHTRQSRPDSGLGLRSKS